MGDLGICAPSAIAAAMLPGPVVRGKVIGKKLRRTISVSLMSLGYECTTAVWTSSVSVRVSITQAL